MTNVTDAYEWRGRSLIGSDGSKIGDVDEIYLDTSTGEPEWATVNTGLFGTKTNFVPVSDASAQGGDVHVRATKDQVKDAPMVDPDGELSDEEERRLYEHYGLEFGDWDRESGSRFEGYSAGHAQTTGRDVSGPETDEAMTRSEEEVAVGTRTVETGRARLRKYVVTEQVQTTVPVQREEVRLEREPITDGNVDRATDGPAISEEEHEVVLHEEEPVVEKRVVPKERVRLEKDTVTEEEEISEEVRKEQIEAKGEVRS
jgi:uncharacterized protein (TIGR02271 family)